MMIDNKDIDCDQCQAVKKELAKVREDLEKLARTGLVYDDGITYGGRNIRLFAIALLDKHWPKKVVVK